MESKDYACYSKGTEQAKRTTHATVEVLSRQKKVAPVQERKPQGGKRERETLKARHMWERSHIPQGDW